MRMSGKVILLLTGMLLPVLSHAQNLIANPGFEAYTSCPTGLSGIDYDPAYSSFPTAKAWTNPLNPTSPDYYNTCGPPLSGVQIPEGRWGYQLTHAGNGYAGIILWEAYDNKQKEYSEYLQTKLLKPMQAGKKYCVSYYVSPTASWQISDNQVVIDEIGVNFSAARPLQATGNTLTLPYSVVTTAGNFLQDTVNWIKVSAIYTATGGEEWATIGKFKNAAAFPNYKQIYPKTTDPAKAFIAYMYIDDFNVVQINGSDTEFTTHNIDLCDTSALPIKINSGGVDGSFLWNTGEKTDSIVVNGLGKYWCTAAADCHIYTDTFIVRYQPSRKLFLGKEAVNCSNQPVTLKAGNKYNSYKWSTGDTTQNIIVSQPGKYYLTVNDDCVQQTDTVTVYIELPPPPPLTKDTMLCQFVNDPQLDASVQGKNLLWYTHPDGVVGNPAIPTIITRGVGKMTIYVTQTLSKCESPKVPVNIDIKYTPRHILPDSTIFMCENNIQYIGSEIDGVKYKWISGETSCCIRPKFDGLQRLIMSNECGVYMDSVLVRFSSCDTCLYIPNAFAPASRVLSNKFGPLIMCPVIEYHMCVYNRWGQKVFESKDVNEYWDGSYKGKMCDNGVFVYTVEYKSGTTGFPKLIKGNVSMFR